MASKRSRSPTESEALRSVNRFDRFESEMFDSRPRSLRYTIDIYRSSLKCIISQGYPADILLDGCVSWARAQCPRRLRHLVPFFWNFGIWVLNLSDLRPTAIAGFSTAAPQRPANFNCKSTPRRVNCDPIPIAAKVNCNCFFSQWRTNELGPMICFWLKKAFASAGNRSWDTGSAT